MTAVRSSPLFVSMSEASRMLGVSMHQVRKLVSGGELQRSRNEKGTPKILRSSVVDMRAGVLNHKSDLRYIGVEEAARILEVTRYRVREWKSSGLLKSEISERLGRQRFLLRSSVLEMQERAILPHPSEDSDAFFRRLLQTSMWGLQHFKETYPHLVCEQSGKLFPVPTQRFITTELGTRQALRVVGLSLDGLQYGVDPVTDTEQTHWLYFAGARRCLAIRKSSVNVKHALSVTVRSPVGVFFTLTLNDLTWSDTCDVELPLHKLKIHMSQTLNRSKGP